MTLTSYSKKSISTMLKDITQEDETSKKLANG